MWFAGPSRLGLIVAIGVWIAIVFVCVVRFTNATRSEVVAALAASSAAGLAKIATDRAAHADGFWRVTEVTTPFGPLALLPRSRPGLRRAPADLDPAAQLASEARAPRAQVCGPIRDRATAELTHLIEFHYQPALLVVIADSLLVVIADSWSSFIVPVLAEYAVLLQARECLLARLLRVACLGVRVRR